VDGAFGAGDYPIPLPPRLGPQCESCAVEFRATLSTGTRSAPLDKKAVGLVPTEGSSRRRTSVFTGKRFRLSTSTLGILSENGERIAVQILKDAVVEVTSGPRPDDERMVDVVWKGKTLTMFAQDIRDRGEELKGKNATKAF